MREGPHPDDEFDEPLGSEECPVDGVQEVTATYATKGEDPYGVSVLACRHHVCCFGPGEPNVIINEGPAPRVLW